VNEVNIGYSWYWYQDQCVQWHWLRCRYSKSRTVFLKISE